jgi:predicted transcriptional regulator
MRISQQKRDKIAEHLLSNLFHKWPESSFTATLASDLARDEEFIKSLLESLKEKGLVVPIKKNSKGFFYSRRIRWRLTNKAHEAYKKL